MYFYFVNFKLCLNLSQNHTTKTITLKSRDLLKTSNNKYKKSCMTQVFTLKRQCVKIVLRVFNEEFKQFLHYIPKVHLKDYLKYFS